MKKRKIETLNSHKWSKKLDCQTMTQIQTAQIIYMHSRGMGIKEIAPLTGFSMGWIALILDACKDTSTTQKFIKMWEDKLNDINPRQSKRVAKTSSSRNRNATKHKSNKKNNSKQSARRPRRRSPKRHLSKTQRRRSDNSRDTGESHGIVDSMRKHVDYDGE